MGKKKTNIKGKISRSIKKIGNGSKVSSITIIALIVTAVIIFEVILSNTALALSSEFVKRAISESGPRPQSTPEDDNQNDIPSNEPPQEDYNISEEETVPEYYFDGITGYVKENVGYSNGYANGSDKTCHDSESDQIGIKDVLVTINGNDGSSFPLRTDDDGKYELDNLSPGTYSIDVQYGKITDDIDMNDSDKVKNILKYNGQDYMTVATPSAQNSDGTNISYTSDTTPEEIEIKQGGKGIMQLMIVLDCSYSMRTNNSGNSDKTRLKAAVESAKTLCGEVIGESDNIYIGLVFFSGTCYRAVSLTRDLNKLYNALDKYDSDDKNKCGILYNDWYTGNTNMVSALDKAYDSFVNNDENSNRLITVISDGIPTSDNEEAIYNDDTEMDVNDKLERIVPKTIDKINEIKEKGAKIYSIITESDDEDEREYANRIYDNNSDVYQSVKDDEANIKTTITKVFKDYLIEQKENYEGTGYTITEGYDDKDRFNEVFENFNENFTYKNSEIFKQIEEGESIDSNKAQELSEKTYMKVNAGSITIPDPPQKYDEKRIQKNPVTGEEYVKTIHHIPVSDKAQIGDVILARRPAFSLKTKITFTGLRVILANGQVVATNTAEVGAKNLIKVDLDKEVAQSATAQIEYTIDIINDSPIVCNHAELISSLPDKFVYYGETNLINDDNKTNSDVGWKPIDITDYSTLKDSNFITQETLDKNNGNKGLMINLNENDEDFNIHPGGDYTVRFVVSRIIGDMNSISDVLDKKDSIKAEILEYQNPAHRRMEFYKDDTSSNIVGIYPGDSKDKDFSNQTTNTATIIPPTGKQEISIFKKIGNEIKLILPIDEIKKMLKVIKIK